MNHEFEPGIGSRQHQHATYRKTLEWQLFVFLIVMIIDIMTQIMHINESTKAYAVIALPMVYIVRDE